MAEFAVLHAHTEFSTRDSLIRATELPVLAAEHGYAACAITDHGGIEGAVPFVEACRKAGVQPIVGCELYVGCEDPKRPHHLTILTKNARGFRSLLKVLSIAHSIGWLGQQRKAVAPFNVVLNNLRDCVVLSGCASSPFWREGSERNKQDLESFVEAFGEDFFFEIQPLYDWDHQKQLNGAVAQVAKKYNRPLVVTPDCHFARPEDSTFHEGLLAIGSHFPVGHERAWKFSTVLNYFMGPEEMAANLCATGMEEDAAVDALANTSRVLERIEDWKWDDLPPITLPTVTGDLRVESFKGLARLGPFPDGGKYVRRLEEELGVFEKAGLGPYLMLVRDVLDYFRSEGAYIGPRGSVAGSLVGYCLGMCDLDPVKHGLPWQRFYAPGRKGWPDVDIDTDTAFRERVPALLQKKFGEGHVAQLSTYGEFKAASSIRDAARAYAVDLYGGLDDWDAESDIAVEEHPLFNKLKDEEPRAAELAVILNGRVRQFGAHAGGFVISADPIADGRGAIVRRGKNDKCLAWDMHAADKLGFVKLDFLGNDSLTALKSIEPHLGDVKWSDIPLNDPAVLDDFSAGRTAGIPQFLTSGLRTFVEALCPTSFEDLMWATAAFRPGALGTMKPSELIAAYRRDPNSIIVYQEELMALCVGLAGFTWSEADEVRKVVGKSMGAKALLEFGDRFVAGCVRMGTVEDIEARKLWGVLADFGRYGFNKAHAASYTWNGLRIAWSKRYRPVTTFAALLNVQIGKKDKKKDTSEQILDDAPDFNVTWLPAHVNKSSMEWVVEDGKIRAPLVRMPGADGRIAKAIWKRREDGLFKDPADFKKRMKKIKYNDDVSAHAFDETTATHFAAPLADPRPMMGLQFSKNVIACTQCDLRATCRAPVPPDLGVHNILIVGESPGKWEDRHGKPFLGESGKLLLGLLEHHGIERDDVTWTNAVKCKPPWTPGGFDYDTVSCPWLSEEIGTMLPPLALAVGRIAWNALGGSGGILKANATVLPGLPTIVACVHPAAVLRDANLLPEIERAVKKFARLYKELLQHKKEAAHGSAR